MMKTLLIGILFSSLNACTTYPSLGDGTAIWVAQTRNEQEVFYCEKKPKFRPICTPAAMLDEYQASDYFRSVDKED